jgi:hypothetical protein
MYAVAKSADVVYTQTRCLNINDGIIYKHDFYLYSPKENLYDIIMSLCENCHKSSN